MPLLDDPFAIVLKEIEALKSRARIIFVDFHAEATSEKIAMGWHLDGKVTAVVGTHTHVQTADERDSAQGDRISDGRRHDRARTIRSSASKSRRRSANSSAGCRRASTPPPRIRG